MKGDTNHLLAFVVLLTSTLYAQEADSGKTKFTKELTGIYKTDYRYYPNTALYAGQHQEYFSAMAEPQFYLEWEKEKVTHTIQFKGFGRIDQYDNNRTHADVRELYWKAAYKKWEISIGAKKVFWGVTESNHNVDIINQLDVLEGFDIEQKLGQPMIHASFSRKWGTLDLIATTYMRQLQFPGVEGRGRPPFIGIGGVEFESDMDEYNPDIAVRWSHSVSIFDIAVSHFYGSARQPYFNPLNFNLVYELINQTGLELQAFTGPMLWKFEGIYRVSERKTIQAFTAGGEFTISNLLNKGIDLGLIAEYNYDDRGLEESFNMLTNDVFTGLRFAFNDRQSTDILGGAIFDMEYTTMRYFVKANRRLGDSWKFSIEASAFEDVDLQELFLYYVRNDGFVQLSLAKYF